MNNAPTASDRSISISEHTGTLWFYGGYVSGGFQDVDGHGFAGIYIETVSGTGTFSFNGQSLAAGQFLSAADIAYNGFYWYNGDFTYNQNSENAVSPTFTYRVVDDGGTANGGTDTATSVTTLTVYIAPVNDAPFSADKTVIAVEDTPFTIDVTHFEFSDVDGDSLAAILVTRLPGSGVLTLDGVAVSEGQEISVADIASGRLIWTPPKDGFGAGLAEMLFKVVDDGIAPPVNDYNWYGHQNTSVASYRLKFDVTGVNDAPVVSDSTAATLENAAVSIDVLADAHDVDGDTLTVESATVLSGFGTVTIGDDGKLIYDPTTAENQNLADGETRTVVIRYTISDGNGGTATADVTVTVTGIEGDIFEGSAADDTLVGSIHGDFIYGYGGNDTLDGGAGADRLVGGSGDDIYIVDDLGDVVVEFAGEGIDLVRSSVHHTLSAHVENLVLTGHGDLNGTGNGLANVITGNAGRNTLDGGAGADRLVGGKGNDIYIVDNRGDVVVERAGEGIDLVRSSVHHTLSAHVENLVLTGSDNLNGTGNGLANLITGNAGRNVLDGRGGADRMVGGKGNDTYIVDNRGDVVVERAGEGVDLVRSSVHYTLSNHVENLVLTGGGNLNGTGNGLANVITGNAGRNTLDGGRGNDTLKGGAGNDKLIGGIGADKLYGGAGADVFVFRSIHDSTVSASGRDTIYDFSRGQGDRIDLRQIDAISRTAVDDRFTFIGNEKFSKTAGELRYEKKGGDTYVYGDVNGDGRADFSIRIDPVLDLTKGDFLL